MNTPGPWEFKTYTNSKKQDKNSLVIQSVEGKQVAKILSHPGDCPIGLNISDQDKSNAQLIAAAPEMLEALKLLQRMMDNLMKKGNVDWGNTFGIHFGLMNEALIKMDRSVAKAEGKV